MAIRDTIINAVAGAMAIAAGSSIISLKVTDATQNARIERIERLEVKIDALRADLQRVDDHLATVDGKLEGAHEARIER